MTRKLEISPWCPAQLSLVLVRYCGDVFPDGPRFGGAPANFACSVGGLARDRIDVYMAGGVGADDPGRRAVEALHLHGVDTSCVAVVDRPTGQVLVKLDAAGRGSYEFAADFAFHPSLASVDDQVIAGLEECAEDGTPSFHGSFEGARGREPLDEGGLWRLLNLARSRKMMAVIHAEDARLNREVIRQTDNAGALENVARCRPWFSETAAVQRSVFMRQITRGPIYFEHLGAGPSLDAVAVRVAQDFLSTARPAHTISASRKRSIARHAAWNFSNRLL